MPSPAAAGPIRLLFEARYSTGIAACAVAIVVLGLGANPVPVQEAQVAAVPAIAEAPPAGYNPSASGTAAASEPQAELSPAAPAGGEIAAEVPFTQGVGEVVSGAERVAPLRIRTASGKNYFLKLVDAQSGKPVATFLVRGGETYETKVPLGAMRIRYASGTTWFGEKALFGPDTSYSEADETFNFESRDGGVSGYTVELIKQVRGNLRTSSIPASAF